MACSYTFTDADGQQRTLGKSEFRAWLVDGGLEQMFPEGVPWDVPAPKFRAKSRSTPILGTTIEEGRAELKAAGFGKDVAAMERAGLLKILRNADELPANMPGAKQASARRIKGAYWRGRGYLVASNIPKGQWAGVLLHEMGEHAALEDMLGPKLYQDLSDQFQRLVSEGNETAVRVNDRVQRILDANAMRPEHAGSERLAYLIETVTNADTELRRTPGFAKVRALVARLVAAIRAWFYRTSAYRTLAARGIKLELTPNDIAALARAAVRSMADDATGKPAAQSSDRASRIDLAPTFYSALTRAIEGMKQPKAPPMQWAAMIARQENGTTVSKLPGVKAEEIDWSGVMEWLKEQKGAVTREQVAEYLRANEVSIDEIGKGDVDDLRQEAQRLKTEVDALSARLTNKYPGAAGWRARASQEEQAEYDRLSSRLNAVQRQGRNEKTQYTKYQVPGGENYRELLMTVPKETNPKIKDWGVPVAHRYGEHESDFRRLAHVRFNERTDADGKRVLFVEEAQSDWHQEGRKKGYKDPTLKQQNFQSWLADRGKELTPEMAQQFKTRHGPEIEQFFIDQDKAIKNAFAVPNAPIKQSWPLLVMKRMIRYAAENGFDRIAWTPGSVQAERYDLSKQVSRITTELDGEGSRWTKVFLYGANPVDIRTDLSGKVLTMSSESVDVTGKDLGDVLGKEMAEKIMAAGPKPTTFAGEDLRVGGKGMEGFYDRILPTEIGKYVKKWDVKPGRAEIAGVNAHVVDITPAMRVSVLEEGQPLFSRRRDAFSPDIRHSLGESDTESTATFPPGVEDFMTRHAADIARNKKGPTQKFRDILAALRDPLAKTAAIQKVADRYRSFKDILGNDKARKIARMAGMADSALEATILFGPLRDDPSGAPDVDASRGGLLDALKLFDTGKGVDWQEVRAATYWIAANRAQRINAQADQAAKDAERLAAEIKQIRKEIEDQKGMNITDKGRVWINQMERLIVHKRAEHAERVKASRIRERYMRSEDIAALLRANSGQMTDGRQRAKVYQQFRSPFEEINNSVVDFAVRRNLIDRYEAERWRQEGFYVPFYRFLQEDQKTLAMPMLDSLANNTAYKQFKGSDIPFDDLLGNVVANWHHLIAASLQNKAARDALASARRMDLFERVPNPHKAGDKDIFVRNHGKAVFYRAKEDSPEAALVLESLTAMNMQSWNNPLFRGAAAFSRILRLGVTVNPAYLIRNLVRDSMHSVAVSKVGYFPPNNLYRGLRGLNPKTQEEMQILASAMASGALFADSGVAMSDTAPERTKALMDNLKVKEGRLVGSLSMARRLWEKYRHVQWGAENANRIAVFIAARQRGENLLDAAHEANDLAAFQVHGSSVLLYQIARLVPFLNARIQGLEKLGRAATDPQSKARFRAVFSTYLLASALAAFALSGDDDYEELEDWKRDAYHWFKIDGELYKIPRPFELGAFTAVTDRLIGSLLGAPETPERVRDAVLRAIGDNLAMDPIPQVLKPAFDVARNVGGFTGRQIESEAVRHLPKAKRADVRTSELAKGLAAGLDVAAKGLDVATGGKGYAETPLSPVQIDALIHGYLGWLGGFVTSVADSAAQLLPGVAVKPAPQVNPLGIGQIPVIGPIGTAVAGVFTEPGAEYNTRFATDFYRTLHHVSETAAAFSKAKSLGDAETLREILTERPEELAANKRLQPFVKAMQGFTRRIRQIEADPRMTAEQKRQAIDGILVKRNAVARRAASELML